MTGLGAVADILSVQLGRLVPFEEEEDRRGSRVKGDGSGRFGGSGVRSSANAFDDLPIRGGGRRISSNLAGTRVSTPTQAGRGGGTGPQAAVIKVASYAAGRRRVGALTDYLSRDGALTVETQSGQKLTGRAALDAELVSWESAFENRAPSKDVASLAIGVGNFGDERLSEGLKQAFAGRKFAWQRVEDDAASVRVVVVLAGQDRRRLDVSLSGRARIAGDADQRLGC